MKFQNAIKKSYFNLVEIIIAMGIVVVCILTIVGLFSVGIGASKDATNSSYVHVAIDEVTGLFSLSQKHPYIDEISPATRTELDVIFADIPDAKPSESLDGRTIEWELWKGNLYKPKTPTAGNKGFFMHRQSTNSADDFISYVRVWIDTVTHDVAVSSGGTVSYNRKLNIEIVWGNAEYGDLKLKGDYKSYSSYFIE